MKLTLTIDEINVLDASFVTWPFVMQRAEEDANESRINGYKRGLRVLAERQLIFSDNEDNVIKPAGELALLVNVLEDISELEEFYVYSDKAGQHVRIVALITPQNEDFPAVSISVNALQLFEIEILDRDQMPLIRSTFMDTIAADSDSIKGAVKGYIEHSVYKDGILVSKNRL